MSDSNDQERKAPLKLSQSGKLELKKTVDAGKVRQSFSHGRSKEVTVEHKKKRTFAAGASPSAYEGRDGAHHGHAEAELAKAKANVEAAQRAVNARDLTNNEKAARARALEAARKAEEDAARKAIEEAARKAAEDAARKIAEEEAARKAAEEEAARKVAEEEAARKAAIEDAARQQAEAEALKNAPPAPAPAAPAPAAKPTQAAAPAKHGAKPTGEQRQGPRMTAPPPPKPAAAATTPASTAAPGTPPVKTRSEEDEEEEERARKKAAVHKPAPVKRVEQRRRPGKLTITDALSEEDRGERSRSLASVRRARERERLKMLQKGAEKVIREVIIPETITVQELANRMAERGGDVIKTLMRIDRKSVV